MPGSESNALSVLITRPQGRGQSLSAALSGLGVDSLLYPTLIIQPKTITPIEKNYVENFDTYGFVLCVSANAANIGLEFLSGYWPQWPVQQQWIAVGPATGEAMQGWGLTDVIVPTAASHSEAVLALDNLQDLTDEKVLILRGVSGRELIADTLRQRGAIVHYLELYERLKPIADPAILKAWFSAEGKKTIVVTSGDGLKSLIALAEEISSNDNELAERSMLGTTLRTATFFKTVLFNIGLVVVSERLAEYAKNQGFLNIWVAEGASDRAILKLIKDKKNEF